MTQVFYCPTAEYSKIIDEVKADQTGLYSGKTKAELEMKHGPLQVMSGEDAVKLVEKAATTDPIAIDQERFIDLLECLPPSKWHTFPGAEAFHVCERITYNIVTWCVRIGKDYFTFNGTCMMTSLQAVELVKAHLEKTAQPA